MKKRIKKLAHSFQNFFFVQYNSWQERFSNNISCCQLFLLQSVSQEMIHFLCLFGIHCTHFRNHTFGVGQKISLHTDLSSVNYSDSNYIEYIIHSVMSTFLMNCHPVVVMSFIFNIASIDSCEFKILTKHLSIKTVRFYEKSS